MRPILAELEALRRETLRNIDFRAAWMVPLGIVAGFVFGMIFERETPVFSALMYGAGGAMGGWAWAFTSLNNAYRRAYKSRIIPHLAACFGELGYRPAVEPDLKRLAKLGLIPGFGKKRVEDEILGTYRGVPLNIVEAKLETGGKNSSRRVQRAAGGTVLPGPLSGVTVVAKDGGVLGNAFRDFVQASGWSECASRTRGSRALSGLQQRPDQRPCAADAGGDGTPDGAGAPHRRRSAAARGRIWHAAGGALEGQDGKPVRAAEHRQPRPGQR